MRCPRCGRELEASDRSCSSCGAIFTEDDAALLAVQQQRATRDTRVMAKWTDDFWYNAEVDGLRGQLRHVRFFDGFELWVEPSEYTCVEDSPVEVDREGTELRVGQMVRVLCPDQQWRPGLIDGFYGRIWHVSLHDVGGAWVAAEMLLAEEEASVVDLTDGGATASGLPGRGARVLAEYPNQLWFPAIVEDEEDELRRVLFFTGKEMWLGPDQVTSFHDPAMFHDADGNELSVGVRVNGQWSDGHWYRGVADARFGRLWHVSFDDYDQAWLEASKLSTTGEAPKAWNTELVQGIVDPVEALEHIAVAAQKSAKQWRLVAFGALLVALVLALTLLVGSS